MRFKTLRVEWAFYRDVVAEQGKRQMERGEKDSLWSILKEAWDFWKENKEEE